MLLLPATLLLSLFFFGVGLGRADPWGHCWNPLRGSASPPKIFVFSRGGRRTQILLWREALQEPQHPEPPSPALQTKPNLILYFSFLFVSPLVPFIPQCNTNPTMETLWFFCFRAWACQVLGTQKLYIIYLFFIWELGLVKFWELEKFILFIYVFIYYLGARACQVLGM